MEETDCTHSIVDQTFVKKLIDDITDTFLPGDYTGTEDSDEGQPRCPPRKLASITCFPWFIPADFMKNSASPELAHCFAVYQKPKLAKLIAFLNPLTTTLADLRSLYNDEVHIFIIQIKFGTPLYFDRLMENLKKLQQEANTAHIMNVPICVGLEIRGRVAVLGRLRKNKDIPLSVDDKVLITNDPLYSYCSTKKHLYINCSAYLPLLTEGCEIVIQDVILSVERILNDEIYTWCSRCGTLKSFAEVCFPYELYQFETMVDEEIMDFCAAHKHGIQFILAPNLRNPLYGCFLKRKLYQMGNTFAVFCQVSRHQLDREKLDKFVQVFDGVFIPGYKKYDALAEKKQQQYLMESFRMAHKRILFRYNQNPDVKISKDIYYNIDCLVIERDEHSKLFPCAEELDILCTLYEDNPKRIMDRMKAVRVDDECKDLNAIRHVINKSDTLSANAAEQALLAHKNAIHNCQRVINGCLTLTSSSADMAAIFVITKTGQSAIKLSVERPYCTIIAITKCVRVAKNLLTWRNIHCVIYIKGKSPTPEGTWIMNVKRQFNYGVEISKRQQWVKSGDRVLFLFNSVKKIEFCDTFKVLRIK